MRLSATQAAAGCEHLDQEGEEIDGFRSTSMRYIETMAFKRVPMTFIYSIMIVCRAMSDTCR